jgi:hypothetical protein
LTLRDSDRFWCHRSRLAPAKARPTSNRQSKDQRTLRALGSSAGTDGSRGGGTGSCSTEQALPQVKHSKIRNSGRIQVLGLTRRKIIGCSQVSQTGGYKPTLSARIERPANADEQRHKPDDDQDQSELGLRHVFLPRGLVPSRHKSQMGSVSSEDCGKYPALDRLKRTQPDEPANGFPFVQHQTEWRTVMPAFFIPVLIGIPVLAIGGWFIFRAVG